MPSPRAVLADIADFGLDPNVAHKSIFKGRLTGVLQAKTATPDEKIVERVLETPPPEPKSVVLESPAEVEIKDAAVEQHVEKVTSVEPTQDVVKREKKLKKVNS